MESHRMLKASGIAMLLVLGCFLVSTPAAILYKNYIVQQDRGRDILCDPYVVQRDDYITKLLKQRGDIAGKDFPKFLEIFSRLNPHIPDPNRIRPGQHIVIPLKILGTNDLPGQQSGVVTIPLVTISNVTERIKQYTSVHRVKRGEILSRLIAQTFGNYGTDTYDQGIALFKRLNPGITDLNLIFQGQLLVLPDPMILKQSWYASIFDASGRVVADVAPIGGSAGDESRSNVPRPQKKRSPLKTIAGILNGRLHESGVYYFPRKDEDSYKLDLSKHHMLELKSSLRLLFLSEPMEPSEREIIRSHWKAVKFISTRNAPDIEALVTETMSSVMPPSKTELGIEDNGVVVDIRAKWIVETGSGPKAEKNYRCINFLNNLNERTPDSIKRYLKRKGIVLEEIELFKETKGIAGEGSETSNRDNPSVERVVTVSEVDPKFVVRHFFKALDIRYAENISITFPYVGIQIEAQSNMASTRDGRELFVDFKELYGDAIRAIQKTGVRIVQIEKNARSSEIIEILLKALDITYVTDPALFASKRSGPYNTRLTIPGFFVENKASEKTLMSATPLDTELISFLNARNIKVVVFPAPH